MTMYEYYEIKSEQCRIAAEKLRADKNLAKFYRNAAEGFETKKEKLTIAETSE